MTREEIIALVREEVARALFKAAGAVASSASEPRRDRPNSTKGPDTLQDVALSVAAQIPASANDAEHAQSRAEHNAVERLKRLRAMPPKAPRKPKAAKGES